MTGDSATGHAAISLQRQPETTGIVLSKRYGTLSTSQARWNSFLRNASKITGVFLAIFVSLGFTDALYLPKRPIAKAFSNASWEQQQRAIANIITLRKHGWRGADLQLHLDAVTQVEKVAIKCLKKGDWLVDHMEEELSFMRGAGFRQ